MKNKAFISGLRDGIPICAGYFAVSFAVGITAKNAGMDITSATLMSFLNLTSAGQAAAIALIAAGTTVTELALTQLIINARYLLMSCSLSQRLDADIPLYHRFLIAFGVTDEIFGIASAYPGRLQPSYCYGAIAVALPGWCVGTAFGVLFGSVLPSSVVHALSVALYGMFLAIIVPKMKEDRVVAVLVPACMAASLLMSVLPFLRNISSGFRIVIITVFASGIAAVLHPIPEADDV